MTKHFMDADEGDCRWPLWGYADCIGQVCGAAAVKGGSYCSEHRALAYRPESGRRLTGGSLNVGTLAFEPDDREPDLTELFK